MSANPIDNNSTPKTTGSLEELFRHHLGDEATVPPRPLLWDQIDNSLLIRQNETYRRRLVATRWVAAASLLLATLAGTGWWAHHAADQASTAVATRAAGADAAATGARPGAARVNGRGPTASQSAASVAARGATDEASSVAATSSDETTGNVSGATSRGAFSTPQSAAGPNSTGRTTGLGLASVRRDFRRAGDAAAPRRAGSEAVTPSTGWARTPSAKAAAVDNQPAVAARTSPSAGSQAPSGFGAGDIGNQAIATTRAARPAAATSPAIGGALSGAAPASEAAASEAVSLLATNPALLALASPAPLPSGLAPVALPAEAAPTLAAAGRKWQYGTHYTVGTFNPNINFSRVGIEPAYDYNPALGPDSPALTEAAATQYRQNLRPGLSQRLALVARRHLGGHWSLSTGAEVAQATAKSASNSAFVGEQLLDLGSFSNGPLRTTSFRYRTAGVPVEVRYSNPEKRGWSLYGRLGGFVSALLGVRSDVEGSPEATRTYSLLSAGTPYRRVLGSVRGGAGAQFRPSVGNWALTLGPVGEYGLVPLNAHPVQSFFAQSRPYSFGIEAGVEFGR